MLFLLWRGQLRNWHLQGCVLGTWQHITRHFKRLLIGACCCMVACSPICLFGFSTKVSKPGCLKTRDMLWVIGAAQRWEKVSSRWRLTYDLPVAVNWRGNGQEFQWDRIVCSALRCARSNLCAKPALWRFGQEQQWPSIWLHSDRERLFGTNLNSCGVELVGVPSLWGLWLQRKDWCNLGCDRHVQLSRTWRKPSLASSCRWKSIRRLQ